MKLHYLKLILGLASLFVISGTAAADSSEVVTNIAQSASLSRAGTLSVAENIDYDFGPAAPHDITFTVPLTYHDDQGREFRMAFNLTSFTQDGQPAALHPGVTPAVARITLPAGTGAAAARHYVVSYTLAPVVLRGLDADILKLSITGLGWSVPITQASLRLETPSAPADNLTCYSGSAGSTTGRCSVDQQGNVSTIATSAPLQPGEALSLFANFPHKSFGSYLEPYEQHPSSPLRKIAEFAGLLLVITLIFVALARWRRRRYTNANEAPKDQANRQ